MFFICSCGEPTIPAAAQANRNLTQTATYEVVVMLPTLTASRTLIATPTLAPTITKSTPPTETAPPTVATTAPPTIAASPTNTLTPTQTPSPTLTPTRTPTPISLCSERMPPDDLLTVVTRDFALSRNYEPFDLVPLYSYFGHSITLGYQTQVREILIAPLQEMIEAMHGAELNPTIISGYRSYSEQYIAWEKWNEQVGERAAQLSAPPGTSEHQLGTTVDFGSPELNNEFHTMFYMTSEGEWLSENAHNYGFTLSYPRNAQEITQFFYEPWHYRYVGVELATELNERNLSLTQYQLDNFPPPCLSGH